MKKDLNRSSLSVVKSLFLGDLPLKSFSTLKLLTKDEQETLELILNSLREFFKDKESSFKSFDVAGEQPASYINSLKELGLFGLVIPEEYEGIGLSSYGYSRVMQEIAKYDGSTALTVGAHNSIGMKGIVLFGSQEQKKKYLPQLANGKLIASFCLTESGAGSDAASIRTTAQKQEDGSWLLNGEKIWITNGAFAGLFTVFAKTDSANGKISAFIVERAWDGVSTGHKEDKMGIRASATTSVNFQNVRVPAENLLGEEGKGFKIAMEILNNGRIGLGGGAVGAMKRSIALAKKQANDRKQFGKKIIEFPIIQEKIGLMEVACFSAEATVERVCSLIDSGQEDYSAEAAISKIYASEALWSVSNEALQIAGGNGFMKDYPYEMIVRDARINMIFEGTNEILRMYVALSGLKIAGDYLKAIGKGVTNLFSDPIKGFGVLSNYAVKKISRVSLFGKNNFEELPSELNEFGEIVHTYTHRLGSAAETVLKTLGGKVVDQQIILKRLSDISIDLFVNISTLSKVVSQFNESDADRRIYLINILRVQFQGSKRRMQNNLRCLISNEDLEVCEIGKGGEYF